MRITKQSSPARAEWYDNLVEECKAVITETIYVSRQALIEGKHQVGELICTNSNFKKMQGSRKANLQQLFEDIGIGKTDGYACVAFYEKFPNLSSGLEKFKEQKNISWSKIVNNYLPLKKEEEHEDCEHKNIIKICNDCKARIK